MIIFFALVFFFGCDKGKVVDKLGKYLTPLLLILLAIVLVKGVISPSALLKTPAYPSP